jgi:hypothetical protein
MPETPEQIKKRIRWEQTQQMYGIIIFSFWIGVVLLVQSFVPAGALFIHDSWPIFGGIGFVWMLILAIKSKNLKMSDATLLIGMILTGPIGIMTYISWYIVARICYRRRALVNG